MVRPEIKVRRVIQRGASEVADRTMGLSIFEAGWSFNAWELCERNPRDEEIPKVKREAGEYMGREGTFDTGKSAQEKMELAPTRNSVSCLRLE